MLFPPGEQATSPGGEPGSDPDPGMGTALDMLDVGSVSILCCFTSSQSPPSAPAWEGMMLAVFNVQSVGCHCLHKQYSECQCKMVDATR